MEELPCNDHCLQITAERTLATLLKLAAGCCIQEQGAVRSRQAVCCEVVQSSCVHTYTTKQGRLESCCPMHTENLLETIKPAACLKRVRLHAGRARG